MAYYDDENKEQQTKELDSEELGARSSTRKPKKQKRPRVLLTFVVGLVLGAFLFAVVLPSLVQYDLLPYQIHLEDQNLKANNIGNGNTARSLQPLSVDVSTQITDVVSKVAPTVVGIESSTSQSIFGGQTSEGTGSGVIYKLSGDRAFVVTNHHVIQGADQIEVILADGTRLAASLRGSDLFTDLAVLEMDGTAVQGVVEIGNSELVKVGEPAIAIGNPLGLDLSGSVTQGIISGKKRAIPQDFNGDGRADWQTEVIQTDAAINPGNSGGALININGQLIGINSMKIAQSSVEGIGFAIPVDAAIPVIEELETEGEMTRAFLGVEAYSLGDVAQVEWQRSLGLPSNVESGIYLQSIEPRSPASEAGLEPYDVITALDGKKINDIIDLRKHLYQEKQPGETMEVTYYREGSKNQVTLELATQK
ncbi:putative serine protease YyxA [Paraliobacillus quinghaiensis]|uniref:Serine protease YyxA n=1 Tax=Paraliobacillus quinghaiensis TaxID=470815 RepID=A0A917TN62_9BACI|nr:trypsin-like peptidase domain-containing protein [Paraliobacillus quinghaiensis]GGM28388.1 putative serine protease YyxA [Paraliobacillus quinghaiensis]